MFCTNCGSQFEEGNAFCPNCGTKVESFAQPVETPAPVAQPIAEPVPFAVPVEAAPVQAAPVEAAPVYATPVEAAPVYATPYEPAPAPAPAPAAAPVVPVAPVQPVYAAAPVAPVAPVADDPDLSKNILIMGIVAVATACTVWFGFLGIIFGIIGLNKAKKFTEQCGQIFGKAKVGKYLSLGGMIGGICVTAYILIYISLIVVTVISELN
ncbi:MAG: zinc-ribbon domain-containing protein [Saccharofermentans sp.]|nr:zinc-ribbon domain-containing protein [Saccharofermentans sp.]